jgi:DNA-binding LytR/AlgR family response regulator
MPEMDGIELARRATEIDPDLKVMFITGFAAVALNPDSKAPKDAKVLSKPFHLRDLVNEVEKDAGEESLITFPTPIDAETNMVYAPLSDGRVAQRESTTP